MLAFVASPHVYNMTHPCSGICREPLWAKGFLSSHRFPAIHPSSSSIHPRHPSIQCHVRHVHPTKTPIPGNGKHPPPTRHILHPYGTHSVRRAQTTRLGPTGEFFFFSFVFFFSNYTPSLRMTPKCHILHPHATHRSRRPQTTRSGPTGEFFFFYCFFKF